MKTTLTVLIGLLFILFSCNNSEEESNEIDAINFENLSSNELEKIGFEKIENPKTFEHGLRYLEESTINGFNGAFN